MKLKEHIGMALELTQRLQEALRQDDLSLAQTLLEQRAKTMQAFQDCHLAAPAGEKEACQSDLRVLQAADQDLISLVLDARDALAREIHKAGLAGPGSSSPYLDDTQQACVNRKA